MTISPRVPIRPMPLRLGFKIVPMVPKDGSATVLVNKGWVPTEEKVLSTNCRQYVGDVIAAPLGSPPIAPSGLHHNLPAPCAGAVHVPVRTGILILCGSRLVPQEKAAGKPVCVDVLGVVKPRCGVRGRGSQDLHPQSLLCACRY